jgi:hypothetical protein
VSTPKVDISKLSKKEKLELLDILERKSALKRLNRDAYKPHGGQQRVHACEKPYRWVWCANGFGKTCLLVNEAFWAAQGYHPIQDRYYPVPAKVVVVIDNPTKIADVFLTEASKWFVLKPEQLHKKGKPYVSEISFDNGSSITFMSSQQEPLAFESIEWDMLIIDEPLPYPVFTALRRGGRKAAGDTRILFAGTPVTGAWMRQVIYEPWVRGEFPDFECFTGRTEENAANLAAGYIDDFKRLLSEKEQKIRLEGMWHDLDGLALSHLFRRETHIVPRLDWPKDWPVVVAIDPHPAKRHYACMLGVDRNGQYYYIKEMAEKAVAREFAKSLHKFMAGYRVIDIVCDSLGSSEMTGGEGFRSFLDILREERVHVRPTRYDEKQDDAWIERIQSVLAVPAEPDQFGQKRPKLLIMEGNPGIIADIEQVQWTKHRNVDEFKPKLDITNRDYLSALKYSLAASLAPDAGRATIMVRNRPVTAYGQSAAPNRRMKLNGRYRR